MNAPWIESRLPGSFHPCEVLRIGNRVARVWQSSPLTSHGAWCWAIGEAVAVVHVTRGNKGIAKITARRALLRKT